MSCKSAIFTANTTAQTVAVGGKHTLALSKDGFVYAWGANDRGQAGNGENLYAATAANPTPNAKPGLVLRGAQPAGAVGSDAETYLHDIVAIAAGYDFSLAVDKDGYVYANDKPGLVWI